MVGEVRSPLVPIVVATLAAVLSVACSSELQTPGTGAADAAQVSADASDDAGVGPLDSGAPDSGGGAPVDAGVAPDVGPADSGSACGARASCGGECVDLATDRAHCGACGRSCGALEICAAERCECEDTCDGRCVDVFSDRAHCGACGNACGADTECLGGVCAARLPGVPTTTQAFRVSAEGANCAPGDLLARPHDLGLAVDAAGKVYLAMVCDGVPMVATSTRGGASYSAPLDLPLPDVVAFEIAAAGAGRLYAAATTGAGALVMTRSEDGGESWDQAQVVDGGPVSVFGAFQMGLSIAVHRHEVFLAVANEERTRARLWRNASGGVGAFELHDLGVPVLGADVLVDPASREIWMMGDNINSFGAFRSRDEGRSFESVYAGRASFSLGTYAIRGEDLFVISSIQMVGTPTSPQRLRGLTGPFEPISYGSFGRAPEPETRSSPHERHLVLDADGTLYFTASRNFARPEHTLSVFRVPAGSLTVDAEISLGARPASQAATRLHALGSGRLLVTYLDGGAVMATTIAFPP